MNAPTTDAQFEPAPADGVLPEGFYATTNLPTEVFFDGEWVRPDRLRMDGVVVVDRSRLTVIEGRRVRKSQRVLVAKFEDGSDGVRVAPIVKEHSEAFQFQSTDVSRERPIDYDRMAALLMAERSRGKIAWVLGPAVVHANAREDLVWFVENGFVDVMLGGNAVAAHDIERDLFGSALGMQSDGSTSPDGHSLHLRAINRVRASGSIEHCVRAGEISGGIMHALVRKNVPFVLAGSIRDDGPLPGVITDVVEAQDAMRRHAAEATMVIVVATQLHGIAFGNMLPSFVETDQGTRSLTMICVDQTEFAVNKLRDRGTHQAFGVLTNAQDFVRLFRHSVEGLEAAGAEESAGA